MSILRLLASLLGAAAVAACGSDDRPGANQSQSAAGRVGVVLPARNDPQYRQLEEALRSGMKERAQEIVTQSAELDPGRQRDLVTTFATQKARAIVLVPLDSTSLSAAVDAAANAGIPVFTIDVPIPSARVTTHVDPDHHAAGYAAAEYLTAFLPKGAHSALLGNTGAHGSRELVGGYNAAARALGARVISTVAPTGGDRIRAAEAMTALLAADPDLDAVFALDPLSALGAMDAAFARRRADVVIVSFGATAEVYEAIRGERPIRLAIVPRPDEAARQLAETMEIHFRNEPVTASIKVPVRLVTIDSLKQH